MKAPELVGFSESGKPRVRMSAGFSWEAFRQLGDAPGGPGDIDFTPRLSGNQEQLRSRDKAVARARDTENNTESIRGALDRKANTVVGAALRPVPKPDLRWLGRANDTKWLLEYQQSAISVFNEWGMDTFCRGDAEGHYQFGGLMWQAFRSLTGPEAEVGGYIGYDRDRADRMGHKWATFVHLVDSARISNPKGASDTRNVKSGRQLDDLGMMEGLYISTRHPGEAPTADERLTANADWDFVPRWTDSGRPMAFHWFFKRRPGMQRALTTLTAVLRTVQLLSRFSDATLQTAVSNALMATYVKTTMSPEQAREHMAPDEEFDGLSEYDLKTAAYKKMDLRFGDKRVPILGPNDEIVFESLEGAAIDFDPFRNAFLRELASSLNVSFEQLSLDFSRASYSSTRSSLMEAWKQVAFERYLFCAHIASLVYDAVIEEAFALGILVPPRGAPDFYEARQAYTRCSWIGPAQGWVDPQKEITAAQTRVALGVSTLADEAANQDADWHERLLQRALETNVAADLGVTIDTGGGGAAAGRGGETAAADETDANPHAAIDDTGETTDANA